MNFVNFGTLLRAAILSLGLASAAAVSQIHTARVTGGTVSGMKQDGLTVFKGIPFAAPPLGNLRWRAPQPVRPWTGTLRADHFSQACSQNPRMLVAFGDKSGVGEDCLTLNIWTPAKAAGETLPVMVWLYGGGFQGGAASLSLYDGAALAKRGVILVSLNYRTGAMGMLAHPELSAEQGGRSGNYGLMDIIAALKWVRANIARFGGDARNVTIFGQSGGAEAVGMLSYSPAAKGLYDKAISESGGNMKPAHRWETDYSLNQMYLPDAEQHGIDYLAKLGVKTIVEARALPAEAVTAKMPEAHGPFWPDFDGVVQPGDPRDLFNIGRFNDVPILIGSNSDDGGGSAQPSTPEKFEAWARTTFGGGADAILAAYPHATNEEASRSSDNIFRDNEYAWSTYQWASLQTANGKAPVYTYYFDRKTERTPNGARHAAELGLVFGHTAGRDGKVDPADTALSDQLMGYWINFAKTGNPNGPALPEWPRFTAKDQRYMALGGTTGPIAVPNKTQLDALSAYYAWRKVQPLAESAAVGTSNPAALPAPIEVTRARLVDCGFDAGKMIVVETPRSRAVLRIADAAMASGDQIACAARAQLDTGHAASFGGSNADVFYAQSYWSQQALDRRGAALLWLSSRNLLARVAPFDLEKETEKAAFARMGSICGAPDNFLSPTGIIPAVRQDRGLLTCMRNAAIAADVRTDFVDNEHFGVALIAPR